MITTSSEVRFYHDGLHEIEEFDENDTLLRKYVYREEIDSIAMMEAADVADVDDDQNTSELIRLFFHYDGRTNVCALTDAAENIVESYECDPYGGLSIKDKIGSGVSVSQVGNPFVFQRRRHDFETGLMYFRARHYDPEAGQWMQRDPLEYVASPNLYEFTSSNPVTREDPLGLRDEERETASTRGIIEVETLCPGKINKTQYAKNPKLNTLVQRFLRDKFMDIRYGTIAGFTAPLIEAVQTGNVFTVEYEWVAYEFALEEGGFGSPDTVAHELFHCAVHALVFRAVVQGRVFETFAKAQAAAAEATRLANMLNGYFDEYMNGATFNIFGYAPAEFWSWVNAIDPRYGTLNGHGPSVNPAMPTGPNGIPTIPGVPPSVLRTVLIHLSVRIPWPWCGLPISEPNRSIICPEDRDSIMETAVGSMAE